MLQAATEFFFKSTIFFFIIGPIGSLIWFCAIFAGVAWAYNRAEPLTTTENRLGIVVPIVWVAISFVASFKLQGFGGRIVIFGFWVYVAYALGLVLGLQRIRFLVFFLSLLVLSLMSVIGFFGIAMTGEL